MELHEGGALHSFQAIKVCGNEREVWTEETHQLFLQSSQGDATCFLPPEVDSAGPLLCAVMPWLRSSSSSSTGQCLSCSPCQRECERTAFSFYCAVREQLPVWLLEEMRSMEVFCWDNGSPRAFQPSEALLYAIVHDHQDYARYLLNRYSVGALRAPACSFCCCPGSGAPHLSVVVRYNRVTILGMVMEALKDCGGPVKRREYLDGRGGCLHAADAGKTAVQLAVELSHPECLLQLLIHGARPDGLEVALQRLVSCIVSERQQAQRCLDFLLLFLAKPPLLPCLRDEPQRWQGLLGNRVFSWLCGLAPSPLLLQALRCLAQSGSDRITSLPDFLQPHS
ncbi:ankyrin repeat domain-containing protein 9 [Poecilia formosa]|uniref:ankyrin repeat domain-containing protein 9 n=1 Tax=Poecilia formosa TaxID=48698 RepID=UPI0004442C6C|nr:PREDICTED: ankyrin repeat domain-containing protein 9 [Poecilia formosa]